MSPLDSYKKKRKFKETPEPAGGDSQSDSDQTKPELLRFVVQEHHATRLHFDFRIEADGVLKSWAVPKGISMNPSEQRLAVQVEDHPIEYGSFEGTIPKGNYGAGEVMIWDEGTYIERNSTGREDSEKAVMKGLEEGHITLLLDGKKLRGEFALVRLNPKKGVKERSKPWLMIKKRDEFSSPRARVDRPKITRKMQNQEGLPRKMKPMLPVLQKGLFDEPGWLYEFDYGGVRAFAEVEKSSVHLFSRQNLSFDSKFSEIRIALKEASLQANQLNPDALVTALLDGEIVSQSQKDQARKNPKSVFWVRDLLHLNGENLRDQPLLERKKKLESLGIFNEIIRYCPHRLSDGKAVAGSVAQAESVAERVMEEAVEQELSGILAREGSSVYRSEISKLWVKIRAPLSKSSSEGKDPAAEISGLRLSNLSKVYWPEDQFTKGDLIAYYRAVAGVLVPHLKDRPQSLHRYPEGIQKESFFQKDLIGHRPRFVETERIYSHSSRKSIDYLLCQNEATLLYMANLGCIEINPWLSRVGSLERPDFVVIDLDPSDSNPFSEVVLIAQEVHHLLDEIGAAHFCKTSGATGIHFFIPLQGRYDYESARHFVLAVCEEIHRKCPENTSLERSPSRRRGKIYLDCFQNAQGQTVASIYSVRPLARAPVSTPLLWEELNSALKPDLFTIQTLPKRLEKLGDLWKPILDSGLAVNLESCLSNLSKKCR